MHDARLGPRIPAAAALVSTRPLSQASQWHNRDLASLLSSHLPNQAALAGCRSSRSEQKTFFRQRKR